jgi:hypothetical protein
MPLETYHYVRSYFWFVAYGHSVAVMALTVPKATNKKALRLRQRISSHLIYPMAKPKKL